MLLPRDLDRADVDHLLLACVGDPAVQQAHEAHDDQEHGNQVLSHAVNPPSAWRSKTTASRGKPGTLLQSYASGFTDETPGVATSAVAYCDATAEAGPGGPTSSPERFRIP